MDGPQQATALGDRELLRTVRQTDEHRSVSVVEEEGDAVGHLDRFDVRHRRRAVDRRLELDHPTAGQVDRSDAYPAITGPIGEHGVDEPAVTERFEEQLKTLYHDPTVVSGGTASLSEAISVDQTTGSS